LIHQHKANCDLLDEENKNLENKVKTLQQELKERLTLYQNLETASKKQTTEIKEANENIAELESKIKELETQMESKVNSYDDILAELKVFLVFTIDDY